MICAINRYWYCNALKHMRLQFPSSGSLLIAEDYGGSPVVEVTVATSVQTNKERIPFSSIFQQVPVFLLLAAQFSNLVSQKNKHFRQPFRQLVSKQVCNTSRPVYNENNISWTPPLAVGPPEREGEPSGKS